MLLEQHLADIQHHPLDGFAWVQTQGFPGKCEIWLEMPPPHGLHPWTGILGVALEASHQRLLIAVACCNVDSHVLALHFSDTLVILIAVSMFTIPRRMCWWSHCLVKKISPLWEKYFHYQSVTHSGVNWNRSKPRFAFHRGNLGCFLWSVTVSLVWLFDTTLGLFCRIILWRKI